MITPGIKKCAQVWLVSCVILLLSMSSCSDEDNPSRTEDRSSIGTARLLPLSGTLFRLGSSDAYAAPDETPGWTRFAHDVWMDTTEMTQAEYRRLRGTNPSTEVGDTLPVTDVSWYDAVLAANARSRRDGFDSVYEYSNVLRDGFGNAWGLGGLVIHLDRAGWRLPTEAEWEAAARAGTTTTWPWGGIEDSSRAGAYAWYQGNTDGSVRRVATKARNNWGLYDMAGNVMEWVGDWKTDYPEDTIEDFAGSALPGDVPEVAVKGGACNYGLSHLRPSSRSATYAALRSSRTGYVGFRLARGAFAARFTDASGVWVETPPVALVRTDIPRLVGSWQSRLVFVNRSNGKGTLTWIDYSESEPVARSLPDSLPVFHPSISPDGRWVAWSTVLEGSVDAGHIRIRRLAKDDPTVQDLGEGSIPRWWTDGTDTFLVRASAIDDMSTGWPGTTTTAQRWSNGALGGSEIAWAPSGSYHDGRSGNFLYTGYRRLRQYDMRSGTSRTLFTAPGNGKETGDTSQVCNVSASPDASGRSLFLDFGFQGSSSLVGRPYGIHEIAFVADSTGKVVRQIPAPAVERQWDHMEWSNSARWAVSGALDATGAYANLYLVDLENSTSTRIVSGTELWQPALWMGGSTDAPQHAFDSAARYQVPAAGNPLLTYEMKMLRFWTAPESLQAVFVGSSRTNFGIAAGTFRMPTFNFGVMAGDLFTQNRMLRDYVLPHCPKLRVVGLCLMPGWMWKTYTAYSWDQIEASVGYRYDRSHGFWQPAPPQWFHEAVATRAATTTNFADIWGSMPIPAGGWGTEVPLEPPDSESFEDSTFRKNWALLVGLISDLDAKGIKVVLVNFPTSPRYATTGYEDFYGPSDSTFVELERRIRALETTYPAFHYYDANKHGSHDYTDAMAADHDHLALLGSYLLSSRLDSLIATF